MVNSMVERATSDMLIGPDWAMNIEICDMLNHDPGQAKDVVKGIKRRIGSRNSKVQLLALTLLETIIKNCGDIVHMHVAEKDVIHEMVKIVKKKPDIHVKEKILVLIDTWQEAFGGPRARYPQYYAAYQELLRAGAVFPQRSERAAPVFTPPQTQPLPSYPPNLQTPDTRQEAAEPSAESEFPSLSLSEIQNARGIMDVLSEMINAIDPENKEGLRQEVVIDLVEQCRTYKQRVVHLVNSTADESLLCQGLALNDDLQRLLAKHEAISSGKPIPEERPKDKAVRSLVDVDSPLVDTGATRKQPDGRSDSSADPLNQLLLTAPPPTTVKVDPKMDLLSGDDFSSPKAEASMALVPVGGHQPTNTPASDQTALVLFDMLSDTNAVDPQPGADLPGQNPSPLPPQQGQQSFQSSQGGFYANGAVPNMGGPQYEQSIYNTQGGGQAWNGQIAQPPQPTSPAYGAESGGSLPPPPWEALTSEAGPVSQYPQGMQANQGQMAGPVPQYPHAMQANQGQMSGPVSQYPRAMQANQGQMLGPGPQYPQAMQANQGQMAGPVSQYPQAMQTNQGQMGGPHYQPGSAPVGPNEQPGGMYMQAMGGQVGPSGYHQAQQQYTGMGMYPQQMYGQQQQMAGYGYGQYLDQRMYGLSVVDGNGMRNPYQASVASASSYVPPSRPSKPEDKLFGDLVDISKFKPVAK